MPILYSIEGLATPYSVPALPPTFATVLASEVGNQDLTDRKNLTVRTRVRGVARGYDSTPPHRTRKPVLMASQIMTAPAECVSLDMTLGAASEIMRKKRFRHLPVVSDTGKLTGILSDRDILRTSSDPSQLAHLHMSSRVLTSTPETPIREIAEALLKNKIGALPIVNEDHKVVGIITTTDILKAVVMNAPLELWA